MTKVCTECDEDGFPAADLLIGVNMTKLKSFVGYLILLISLGNFRQGHQLPGFVGGDGKD